MKKVAGRAALHQSSLFTFFAKKKVEPDPPLPPSSPSLSLSASVSLSLDDKGDGGRTWSQLLTPAAWSDQPLHQPPAVAVAVAVAINPSKEEERGRGAAEREEEREAAEEMEMEKDKENEKEKEKDEEMTWPAPFKRKREVRRSSRPVEKDEAESGFAEPLSVMACNGELQLVPSLLLRPALDGGRNGGGSSPTEEEERDGGEKEKEVERREKEKEKEEEREGEEEEKEGEREGAGQEEEQEAKWSPLKRKREVRQSSKQKKTQDSLTPIAKVASSSCVEEKEKEKEEEEEEEEAELGLGDSPSTMDCNDGDLGLGTSLDNSENNDGSCPTEIRYAGLCINVCLRARVCLYIDPQPLLGTDDVGGDVIELVPTMHDGVDGKASSSCDSKAGVGSHSGDILIDEFSDHERPHKKVCREPAAIAPLQAPMTDYERERLDNIRRNLLALEKLGVSNASAGLAHHHRPKPVKPKSKGSSKDTNIPTLPLRRSARGKKIEGEAEVEASIEESKVEHKEKECKEKKYELQYEDSSVLKYACYGQRLGGGTVDRSSTTGDIIGFHPLERELFDPKLTRIYTMDAAFMDGNRKVLLAAGGHKGHVSVFATSSQENVTLEFDTELLLSWKASSSWISNVKLLYKKAQETAMPLLSSANDGNLVLWDINKKVKLLNGGSGAICEGSPYKMAEALGIHSNGIFAMDEYDDNVVTASKDSTLACCTIGDSSIVKERSILGHHSGPIRGVNIRDKNTVADGGGDGLICILDLRLGNPCTVTMDTQDPTGVNMVQWSPHQDHLLLSASRDPHLLLHDVRNCSQPLYRLSGHMNPSLHKCSNIYRPAFVASGRAIATPGQGSGHLSLYSAGTGKTISRGFLGYDATMVMSSKEDSFSLLWVAGRSIAQLTPIWASQSID